MPEANISPRTDDETTRAGAAPAVDGDGEEGRPGPGAEPAPEAGLGRATAPGEEPFEETGLAGQADEAVAEAELDERTGLTPRQARRVRSVVSGIVMAAVAVALVVRLGSAPSVLTVGFYGIALILSGAAIGLSRRGRTRVATGVLVLGFAAVALAEWLLASAE